MPIATNIGTSIAATCSRVAVTTNSPSHMLPRNAAQSSAVGLRVGVGQLGRPRVEVVAEQLPVLVVEADRLEQHGAREPFGIGREQPHHERAADAHPEHVAALDAELVEQRQLVVAIRGPSVGADTGAVERPALRWSMPINLNPSASASLGFHGIRVQNSFADRIPPGAISSTGKPSASPSRS